MSEEISDFGFRIADLFSDFGFGNFGFTALNSDYGIVNPKSEIRNLHLFRLVVGQHIPHADKLLWPLPLLTAQTPLRSAFYSCDFHGTAVVSTGQWFMCQ